MRRVLIVMGVMAVLAPCAGAGMASPAVVSCPRLAAAPTIDGLLGSGEWADAGAVGPFVLEAGGMPSLVTNVYLGYDDTALYVGARLKDPSPLEVQCAASLRDGAVLADDSLALLLDPGNDAVKVMELAVNAAGTEYDAIDGDPEQNVAWRSAAHIGEDGWLVEMAYLFGSGGVPQEGATWGLDVRRWAPRIGESSSMSGAGGLGTLVFGRPALRCQIEPIDAPWFGENTSTLAVANLRDEPQTVKINVRVTGPTRRAHFFDVTKLTLNGAERRNVAVTYRAQRGGRCNVEISMQAIEGTQAVTALRTAPMEFELPAMGAELDEALSQIARAYKTYALLPKDLRPFGGASRLSFLLARWRYLDSRQQAKASLNPEEAMAVVNRARAVAQDAMLLDQELRQEEG